MDGLQMDKQDIYIYIQGVQKSYGQTYTICYWGQIDKKRLI